MRDFDKISIQEMSKNDMLMILEALEFTGQETKIDDFIELKENILEELSSIAEVNKEEFFDYLKE